MGCQWEIRTFWDEGADDAAGGGLLMQAKENCNLAPARIVEASGLVSATRRRDARQQKWTPAAGFHARGWVERFSGRVEVDFCPELP